MTNKFHAYIRISDILQLQDYLQISTVLQGSNLNTVYTTFRERSSQIKLVQIVLKLH